MGLYLNLGQSHNTKLVLTPSFLTMGVGKGGKVGHGPPWIFIHYLKPTTFQKFFHFCSLILALFLLPSPEKISANTLVLDPAVLEIFYFKHDVGASNVINFVGNPNVGSVSDAIPVLTYNNAAITLLHRVVSLRTNRFDLAKQQIRAGKKSNLRLLGSQRNKRPRTSESKASRPLFAT